jgi:hypothetical protein
MAFKSLPKTYLVKALVSFTYVRTFVQNSHYNTIYLYVNLNYKLNHTSLSNIVLFPPSRFYKHNCSTKSLISQSIQKRVQAILTLKTAAASIQFTRYERIWELYKFLKDYTLSLYLHKSGSTHQFFASLYFNVVGTDTRAESMFLNEPPLTLHSICTEHSFPVN